MAAAPPSLGEQIREELSCSICLELFTRPKVLPCQHTFCQDCLQDHAGRGGVFTCPNCRRQISLPSQGVKGLPDNHLVSSLCARLQGQATLSEKTSEQPQPRNRCSFHPSEELKLYCMQCQLPVCIECCEEGHAGHPTTGLKKAAQERRSTVQTLINEGRNNLETYCSFIRSLRQKEKTLNEQKQQRDNSIIQAYNKMVLKLTERKDDLLYESERNYRENLDRFQHVRDRVLADVSELSAACDRAEQELEQFLGQETILVLGKYRGKAAPTPVQTQPAVFQPTDTPVPVLGHVTDPSAPIPAAPAASNVAARVSGHHHGNLQQGGCQPQRLKFGGQGVESQEFKNPSGVTVSDEGEVFVADCWNQRIQVFTLQGTFVRQFPAPLTPISDVAMDGEGNLWVVGSVYTQECRASGIAIQYTKDGRVLRKFKPKKIQSSSVSTIAVDKQRNHILVLVQDLQDGKHHMQVYRPDGTLVKTVDVQKVIEEERNQQQGTKALYPPPSTFYVTTDGEGNILLSIGYYNCVFVFKEDGQFLFHFGDLGSGEGELKGPSGICTDRVGNIIVADSGNRRVEMFDKTGRFIKHITTDMTKPCAVAMATQGQVVVTDSEKHSVSIFYNF
ncbi:tripartite motif-containing protein 3-like [Branchiostoma floridae]|uniref:RING-type E3 ubiquitin transferase n=1 Tax=Branchiostoma floridae TaxID=7739 RepID=A0A9J7HTF6_BRAFL|nr:tripartite motif-containing protein 3-like [Branchiostoma floridae]